MEQTLLKYIDTYTFPLGKEPVILSFKIKRLYKEVQTLFFDGENENDDLMYGKFTALSEEQQKIIFDRFIKLNT